MNLLLNLAIELSRCRHLCHPGIRLVAANEAFKDLNNKAKVEEGEEDDEIKDLLKPGRKKKNERSAAEIAELVETLMAELEVVAEEDAVLNTLEKPAINKLRKLPLLTEALSKKQLQHEFLDHGVLTSLKKIGSSHCVMEVCPISIYVKQY
ncbi:protein IWS1 homolog 1-like isoform X2 [Amaranthus tricolor]|uniref:protein IWS1 homolog 1-like isoform X2 n=1 Tax=Amaranthus tricolor TaxID=29722 RepID=UPI0025893B30|nr:protein IWS1 homolog 1-like isoform X2 [Amaranthus tricolor]XP_057525556.1 protein IWS1 homolog 1-like isoform X2 [Amaranthus tricolor]XP_057525557.1 protein IWS1 homolog 1-like isoform X2 [Amaranthus tricolor]